MSESVEKARQHILACFGEYRAFVTRCGEGLDAMLVASARRRGLLFQHAYRERATGKLYNISGFQVPNMVDFYKYANGSPRVPYSELGDRTRFEYSRDDPDSSDWAWYRPERFSMDQHELARRARDLRNVSLGWIDGLTANVDRILEMIAALDYQTARDIAACAPNSKDIVEMATEEAFPGSSRENIGLSLHRYTSGDVLDLGPNVHHPLHKAVATIHGVPLANVGY